MKPKPGGLGDGDVEEGEDDTLRILWIMMRILAAFAAVVLSYMLYRFSKGAWQAYKDGEYSSRSRTARHQERTRRLRSGGAIYQRVEYRDNEDGNDDDDESLGFLGDDQEEYRDWDSVGSGSKPGSPILLQKPLPERPLPDKPLPPVPRSAGD